MADNGWGGTRRGAGRKPSAITEARAVAAHEAIGDAEFALGLLIHWMRDTKKKDVFRKACAIEVMDRVWGKATQRNENANTGEMRVLVEYADAASETDAA